MQIIDHINRPADYNKLNLVDTAGLFSISSTVRQQFFPN